MWEECFLAEYLLCDDDENALSLKTSGFMVKYSQMNRSVILKISISEFRFFKNLASYSCDSNNIFLQNLLGILWYLLLQRDTPIKT